MDNDSQEKEEEEEEEDGTRKDGFKYQTLLGVQHPVSTGFGWVGRTKYYQFELTIWELVNQGINRNCGHGGISRIVGLVKLFRDYSVIIPCREHQQKGGEAGKSSVPSVLTI